MLTDWTLADIDDIARTASRVSEFMRRGETAAERFHTARCAIVIELASGEELSRRELVAAGLRAIDHERKAWARTWGYDPGSQSAKPAFWRYWQSESSPGCSPERSVVDGVALVQIWPRLSSVQREAMEALAVCEDYQVAADMLGLDFDLFRGRVRNARRRFLELWHEGEAPSQVWRRSDPQRRADRCVKGHELAGENLGWSGRPGRRKKVCRSCARQRTREYRERQAVRAVEGGDPTP